MVATDLDHVDRFHICGPDRPARPAAPGEGGGLTHFSVTARRVEMAKTLALYTHPPVLVIDEVGYLAVGGDAANLIFQVAKERDLHRRLSEGPQTRTPR